jgi:hypothetical protein
MEEVGVSSCSSQIGKSCALDITDSNPVRYQPLNFIPDSGRENALDPARSINFRIRARQKSFFE